MVKLLEEEEVAVEEPLSRVAVEGVDAPPTASVDADDGTEPVDAAHQHLFSVTDEEVRRRFMPGSVEGLLSFFVHDKADSAGGGPVQFQRRGRPRR